MSSENSYPAATEAEAAQEVAQQAVVQARETAEQALDALKRTSASRLCYLGCMAGVVVSMLVFDVASFRVATPGIAVSETMADAQRTMEARLNSLSYSAFASTLWGKLAWLSAAAGFGLMVASAIGKARGGWVPLAIIGCGAFATLLLILVFFVGFPDLSAYADASCSATLFGYWLPLFASAVGTACAVKPILLAK
ncbi:MAG: hypothetical protein AAF802_16540 [Planctomycetota bacterium]